jgi:transposase
MNSKQKSRQGKVDFLRESGTLNPLPERVQSLIFKNNDFFDSRDIVQVKYELLRQVQVEGVSISDAVKSFGFSRLSYYRIRAIFEECGLGGLIPQKRGPKRAHKLNIEILQFIDEQMEKIPSISILELQKSIKKKFEISVHSRTIERALIKKKRLLS